MKRLVILLFATGCLVGAPDAYAAEAPPPTVSVEGVATVPISRTASQAEANATYRAGLAAAIADGLEKAQFLATSTGSKIGTVQQAVEQGGYVECIVHAEEGPVANEERYDGAEPDFGTVEGDRIERRVAPELSATPAPTNTKAKKPTKKKTKKHKHKPKAKKSAASGCTLSTRIVLSYLLT